MFYNAGKICGGASLRMTFDVFDRLCASTRMSANPLTVEKKNSPRQVLLASLIGTTIEFFDFYIYATAAVLVFPALFFPKSDPVSARLASLATFGIAFLARPVGSALFGHFGDRIGRKTTLVIALLTMGVSTVAIGALPTYKSIGVAAPVMLAACRFGQGIGLGGEWGGALLLAVENATAKTRAWYGMFPQLGAPVGLFTSGAVFLVLSHWTTEAQFLAWGWRLPFLASAALVLVGLYVRLTITETPVFQEARARREMVRVPLVTVVRRHTRALVAGVLSSLATFVIVYLVTTFALLWGTTVLGYTRNHFLLMELVGVVFFGAGVPWSARLAALGRKRVMVTVTVAIGVFGAAMGPLFGAGVWGAMTMLVVGMALMGVTYGTLGVLLSELFPTAVRYTGCSLAFNLAAILGASMAPYVATWLAERYGLWSVGVYLLGSAVVTLAGLGMVGETRGVEWD
jgi:metabolite-proton symporter